VGKNAAAGGQEVTVSVPVAPSPQASAVLTEEDRRPLVVGVAPPKSAPASSTGAIPKSISFDKNVYDGSEGDRKHGRGERGFFRSFKLPKIGSGRGGGSGGTGSRGSASSGSNSRSASVKSDDFGRHAVEEIPEGAESNELRRTASDETSDDILAKYRKKNDATDAPTGELVSLATEDTSPPDERQVIDPQNVEASYAFEGAKRKLRLMLSELDPAGLAEASSVARSKGSKEESELVSLLKVQLAEANNLQDRGMVAQLHETLRCLELFDTDNLRRLLRSLKEDYRRRAPYLGYLVRCRQGLLAALARQQRLLNRVEVDRRVCSQYLISVCVRLFLERRERQIQAFLGQFRETQVADERVALVDRTLNQLWRQLEEDPAWALVASGEQMEEAREAVERAVAGAVYGHAMYPNGDADVSRDRVLQSHISRLANGVTPVSLGVPRRYHYEAPWPSAQAEIRRLPAFKTARDKVACVRRCSQTIMNILSLAAKPGGGVPAADDFVPVLVFVLIRANPPGLLSTVQYVDSFYGARLCGEDQYWWMQFASAIEYIKTMD